MTSARDKMPVMSTPRTAPRSAVGYVRVSTDMQAADGLSLDAQREAIRTYCAANGLRLVKIYQDVLSGGRADRPGLADALKAQSDVFVVLKFDRLSRSVSHFCQMFETHFEDGKRELVAIREAIRLDQAMGRALVKILMTFAQMEREATGERVRETISHIRGQGYHYGKVPFAYEAVPAPENPRYRQLQENPEEQATIALIKDWVEQGRPVTAICAELTKLQIKPPQGQKWTISLLYNLKKRQGWHQSKPINTRNHTDDELKQRMRMLRDTGHTYKQIANRLNEEGYLPLKGKKFAESNICRLLGRIVETKQHTPRAFCESIIRRADGERPSYPKLARALSSAGFLTPKGNIEWWPAQVQRLLEGAFDEYYKPQKTA